MSESQKAQSVLLLHAGSLGDFVLSVSCVHELEPAGAGFQLHTACRCPLARFFVRHGVLADWRDLDGADFLPLFREGDHKPGLRTYLDSFDVVISMLGPAGTPLAERLECWSADRVLHLAPQVRAGTEQSRDHVVTQWSADLAAQGLAHAPGGTSLCLTQFAAPTTPEAAGVLIHPGSGGTAKCWPVEHFEKLGAQILLTGSSVTFMLGPVEQDIHGPAITRHLETIAPVIYEEDVCIAAEKIGDYAVYVGNDAGMTHLAAALGVPTVAIFVSTDPAVWAPRGPDVHVIQKPDVRDVLSLIAELCESHYTVNE